MLDLTPSFPAPLPPPPLLGTGEDVWPHWELWSVPNSSFQLFLPPQTFPLLHCCLLHKRSHLRHLDVLSPSPLTSMSAGLSLIIFSLTLSRFFPLSYTRFHRGTTNIADRQLFLHLFFEGRGKSKTEVELTFPMNSSLHEETPSFSSALLLPNSSYETCLHFCLCSGADLLSWREMDQKICLSAFWGIAKIYM